jgi:hypothetical protein
LVAGLYQPKNGKGYYPYEGRSAPTIRRLRARQLDTPQRRCSPTSTPAAVFARTLQKTQKRPRSSQHAAVRSRFQQLLERFAREATGSSRTSRA